MEERSAFDEQSYEEEKKEPQVSKKDTMAIDTTANQVNSAEDGAGNFAYKFGEVSTGRTLTGKYGDYRILMQFEPQGDHHLLFMKVIVAFDDRKVHGYVLLVENSTHDISKSLKEAIKKLSFVNNDFEFIERFKVSAKPELNQLDEAHFAAIRIKIQRG